MTKSEPAFEQINAAAVRAALANGPLRWRQLAHDLDAPAGERRRKLRLVVKGLVRVGEIISDHEGAYRLAGQDLQAGEISAMGKRLVFDGVPLAPAKGQTLRPGDKVKAEVRDGLAYVVELIELSPAPVLGELRMDARYPYVEALGPGYKGRVSLLEPPAVGEDGDSVAVRIVEQDRRGLAGVVIEVVASGGGASQAAETLLSSHDVPVEWPAAVTRAARGLPKAVDADAALASDGGAAHQRVDLRELPLVTIDGATAKDFDDAVFAERKGRGWRVVVAIADVANYVEPDSALDTNAWERGNSVYLPDRVIPMLPESLSNGLCSLRPKENRLALVCDMRVSPNGRISSFEFYEALINSHARLIYENVWDFLQSDDAESLQATTSAEVQKSLKQLHAVFAAFRAERDERGGLDFESREANIVLSGDTPVDIVPVERNPANQLIEEAMIAANVCAARFLEKAGQPALYRIHEPPGAEKTEQLEQALALIGMRVPHGELTPVMLQTILVGLENKPNRWLFEQMVLRSMNQAVYARENQGHFGLALPRYMHFTSPIRRYADLVVHRAIKAVLHQDPEPVGSLDWLDATAGQISMTERRADEVSWGVDGWLKAQYMSKYVGETLPGTVVGVTEFGLFVELDGFFVQGLVHISELGADYFSFQPASLALVGERSGQSFSLGDKMQVQVASVQPSRGRIDLVPENAEPKERGGRRGESRGGRTGKAGRSGKQGGRKNDSQPKKSEPGSTKSRGSKTGGSKQTETAQGDEQNGNSPSKAKKGQSQKSRGKKRKSKKAKAKEASAAAATSPKKKKGGKTSNRTSTKNSSGSRSARKKKSRAGSSPRKKS